MFDLSSETPRMIALGQITHPYPYSGTGPSMTRRWQKQQVDSAREMVKCQAGPGSCSGDSADSPCKRLQSGTDDLSLSHFYCFWLPEYLSSARGPSLAELGRVVWIPYLFGGLGNLCSGYAAGQLQKRGTSVDRSRRLPLFTGAVIVSAANFAVYFAPSVPQAVPL